MYRILIADDERLEREALESIVRQHCPWIDAIDVAPNGREAVTRARETAPDIALLDIRMPGIDGLEAAALLLESTPHCRVAFLTAFDYFDFAQSALRLGASDFLLKPADTRSVVALLDRLRMAIDAERARESSTRRLETWSRDAATRLEADTVAGLVLGTVDGTELRTRLALLEVDGERFAAVAVRPDYERYPLPVTSREQRKLIDRRVAVELTAGLRLEGVQAIATSALSVVYLLLSLPVGTGVPGIHETLIAAAHRLRRDHHLVIRYAVSEPFDPGAAVRPRFLEAREALTSGRRDTGTRPSGPGGDTPPRYPFSEERAVVHALGDGREDEALEHLDGLFAYLERTTREEDEFALAVYELLVYLRHAFALTAERSDVPPVPRLDAEDAGTEELCEIARAYLHRLVTAAPAADQGHARLVVERACAYIREHYREDISLETVAASLRVSTYHLSRLFRHVSGSTFVAYLTGVRIDRAKSLLSESDLSMKEVADLVGYSDPNYFSRVFRKREGVTPSHFRDKKMLI